MVQQLSFIEDIEFSSICTGLLFLNCSSLQKHEVLNLDRPPSDLMKDPPYFHQLCLHPVEILYDFEIIDDASKQIYQNLLQPTVSTYNCQHYDFFITGDLLMTLNITRWRLISSFYSSPEMLKSLKEWSLVLVFKWPPRSRKCVFCQYWCWSEPTNYSRFIGSKHNLDHASFINHEAIFYLYITLNLT